VRDEWLESGLDSVELNPYELLLSYPNQQDPNIIQMIMDDQVVYTTTYREDLGPKGSNTRSDKKGKIDKISDGSSGSHGRALDGYPSKIPFFIRPCI
jgi:hypothetical protein